MINAGTGITPLSCSIDQSIMFISRDKRYCDNEKIPGGTRTTWHNLMLSMTSDCPAATFAHVQRHSSEMTWWQDVMVWLSWCHVIWSHRGSWTRQIYLLSPTIVSDDSMISLFLFHHLLRSRHLTSLCPKYTCLWSGSVAQCWPLPGC